MRDKREAAESLANYDACVLINEFFKGNKDKALTWWNTSNPLLGDITPVDMVKMGRSLKLLKIIKELIAGNLP